MRELSQEEMSRVVEAMKAAGPEPHYHDCPRCGAGLMSFYMPLRCGMSCPHCKWDDEPEYTLWRKRVRQLARPVLANLNPPIEQIPDPEFD